MNTRQALHASLAITPDSPEEAARKMHLIAEWVQLEDALERALRFAKRRNGVVLHHWLNRAACLFLGLMEDAPMQSQATVTESDSKTLVDEVVARALAGEPDARRAILAAANKLKSPLPRKKEKGR